MVGAQPEGCAGGCILCVIVGAAVDVAVAVAVGVCILRHSFCHPDTSTKLDPERVAPVQWQLPLQCICAVLDNGSNVNNMSKLNV